MAELHDEISIWLAREPTVVQLSLSAASLDVSWTTQLTGKPTGPAHSSNEKA
jgi:hypothetical protein